MKLCGKNLADGLSGFRLIGALGDDGQRHVPAQINGQYADQRIQKMLVLPYSTVR